MVPPEATAAVQRQTAASFDRAFQNLFALGMDVIALYRRRNAIEGSESSTTRLSEIPPHLVEEHLLAYKNCFDSTGPPVHVDAALELYAKYRQFLLRGYQCNSWLMNDPVALYYGETVDKAEGRIVHLDCLYQMLESLRRADTQFRNAAAVLRIRFSVLLYTVFMAALKYSNLIEGDSDVRGVVPPVSVESELKTLEALHAECLNDLPKPERSAGGAAPSGAANPLAAGLASMMPGGFGDVIKSLLATLPEMTRTVTETMSRTMGTTLSPGDHAAINSVMSNITTTLSEPEGLQNLIGEMSTNGAAGFAPLVEKLLSGLQPTGSAASTAPAVTDAPASSSGSGADKLD